MAPQLDCSLVEFGDPSLKLLDIGGTAEPGGRIALAVQYGHAATTMSESYAGRSKANMLDILDLDKGLALADALTDAATDSRAGEKVTGPPSAAASARRPSSPPATPAPTPACGNYAHWRANPRLQIYEDSPPAAPGSANPNGRRYGPVWAAIRTDVVPKFAPAELRATRGR